MSNPLGGLGSTTFAIHTDMSENAQRKSKAMDPQAKAPATKRAALGTITNTQRIQPVRAAKQGLSSDNICAFKQNENVFHQKPVKSAFAIPENSLKNQPFSIHIDGESSTEKLFPVASSQVTRVQLTDFDKRSLQLHPDVTTLSRAPLSVLSEEPILIEDSSSECESPMLLDTSVCPQNREDVCSPEERLSRILCAAEYSEDIYKHLRDLEKRHRAKAGYMKKQPDITSSMRSILVDWLVEVAEEYKLHRETLCLSVNYIDRFLSQMSVLRGKLQLVGAASMFLAAKFEEIYPPEVGEFVYITDDTYTKKQVLRMEHLVLKVLSFDVAVPTLNCFCERFCKATDASERLTSLAMYLAEMTMVDADPFLKYLPSEISAAALCLARHTLNMDPWPTTLQKETGYQISDLQACLQDLYTAFNKAPNHPQQAVREKYKQSKYQQVSLLCPPPSLPIVTL